jgi:hypothetical protein
LDTLWMKYSNEGETSKFWFHDSRKVDGSGYYKTNKK